MEGKEIQCTQATITERLKGAGWVREDSAEELDWPDFEFDNGSARVELLYPPDEDWVRVGVLTKENEGYLKIAFQDKLDALLDVLIAAQGKLDSDHWESFIDELLAIPLRVFALTGEDGDNVVELRNTPGSL